MLLSKLALTEDKTYIMNILSTDDLVIKWTNCLLSAVPMMFAFIESPVHQQVWYSSRHRNGSVLGDYNVMQLDGMGWIDSNLVLHGPLTRYAKLRVARALGMSGTFSPPLQVSDPDIHHGTRVTHVPWCMPGSITSSFLWSSRYSRRMRNPQFWVFGKRPMRQFLYVNPSKPYM